MRQMQEAAFLTCKYDILMYKASPAHVRKGGFCDVR